jgi:hypothetical protein
MHSLTAGQYFRSFYTIFPAFATGSSPWETKNPSNGINALESLSGNDIK